jgi:hypothetical protein
MHFIADKRQRRWRMGASRSEKGKVMAGGCIHSDLLLPFRAEAAERLKAAERALRAAQAELRISDGSNAARQRYVETRAALAQAEAFAIQLVASGAGVA